MNDTSYRYKRGQTPGIRVAQVACWLAFLAIVGFGLAGCAPGHISTTVEWEETE